jgi:hypothetical protein
MATGQILTRWPAAEKKKTIRLRPVERIAASGQRRNRSSIWLWEQPISSGTTVFIDSGTLALRLSKI